jgi:competence protein ComFB
LVENLVIEEYDKVVATVEDFCGCEMCREDVLVYTLNRLPPQYVAQPTGEVLARVSAQADQSRADISVMLLDGMRKVKAAPRKGH